MKIEYDLKRAGLTEARQLKRNQCFVNGGLMSEPNLFIVVDEWKPPRPYGKAYADQPSVYRAGENDFIGVFNLSKGRLQTLHSDKMVAIVNVKVVVMGYADPKAALLDPPAAFASMSSQESEVTEYTVRWVAEVDALSPLQAAQLAQEIIRDPLTTATVFDVTDSNDNTQVIDLGKPAPTGHGG
jgi:hypothetical protein